jgi:hypothetical protein
MHFLKRRNGVGGYWIEYINWVKIKTNEGALISESHLESNSLIYGVGNSVKLIINRLKKK